MNFSRRNPHSRRLAGVLAGILAAMAIPGLLPMQGGGQASEQQATPQQETPTFKLQVERNLVPVRVVARDRQGRAVGGLRKEDFKLFDNGKPQVITEFSVETSATPPATAAKPAPPETPPESAPPSGAPAIPHWRYLGLFFDDLNLSFGDLARARDAADRFLTTALMPSDRAGILTSSGLNTLDFTDDRAKLHEALFKLRPNSRIDPRSDCPEFSDYQAEQIVKYRDADAIAVAVDEDVNRCHEPRAGAGERVKAYARRAYDQYEFQAHFSLQSMEQSVRRMATLPGQRSLILVSGGFLPLGRRSLVDEVADRALRSNVVISSLDPKGLAISLRELDVSRQYLPAGALASSIHNLDSFREKAASALLAQLAEDTGGEFFHNNNDLDAGFAKVTATPEVYYTLAFSPQNLKYDGRFHSLKVELVSHSGLSVVARRGYFAPRKLPDAVGKVGEEVEAAAFSLAELKELPVDVRTQLLKSGKGNAQLEVLVHVDIHTLRLRKERDRNANELMFVTVLFDRDGKYVNGKRSQINLNLRDSELERARASGIDLKAAFLAKPGTYLVREVVRDSEDGHLAALNSTVEIPTQESLRTPTPRAKAEVPDLSAYRQADRIIDHPIERLRKEIPELKNLQPSTDQSSLPLILSRVGDNLALFLKNFVNTTSLEDIDEYRRGERANVLPSYGPGEQAVFGGAHSIHQRFRYLMLARPDVGDRLEEYRTGLQGDDRRADRPVAGFLRTVGFASLPLLLDHHRQPLSDFRHLGAQEVNGRLTQVVAFAQHPDPAGAVAFLGLLPEESIPLLLQGVAWIDAENYQIVRIRTDLLAPLKSAGLQQETAVVRLHPVTFRQSPAVLWLPQEVEVTAEYRGMRFENRHRYSHYELFNVETEQKVQSPEPDSGPPQR